MNNQEEFLQRLSFDGKNQRKNSNHINESWEVEGKKVCLKKYNKKIIHLIL
jgi:hypothetical protein